MFQGHATLIVDLGNSETRLQVKVRNRVSDIISLSNQYANIPSNYEVPASYCKGDSLVFHCNDSRYAHGELALKEFSSYLIKPTAIQPKAESSTTVLAREVIFYHAYHVLGNLVGVPMKNLDVTWDIIVLSPPLHMALKDKLIDIFSNPAPLNVTVPVRISISPAIGKVKVVPEGVAAFFAVVFDKHLKVKPEYQNLGTESVMIVDIGAGTTDVCVIEQYRAIEDTMDTYPIGGNNVYQQVGKILKAEGRNIREDLLMNGVVSGIVTDGRSEVDITDKVNAVKVKISQALKNNIRRSFESNLYDPRGIQFLMVIGGGALEGATPSMGTHLLNAIRELSPNVELLPLPDGVDLRHLNINGAMVISQQG